MSIWVVMWCAQFNIHANDDAEETADFWHWDGMSFTGIIQHEIGDYITLDVNFQYPQLDRVY